MSRRALLLPVLLAVAGCGGQGLDLGFAVAMNLIFDGAIEDASLAKVVGYSFHASGDETFTQKIDLGRPAQRVERVVYRPLGVTHTLTIEVSALDADGAILASGRSPALTLTPGATAETQVILLAEHELACTADAACDLACTADAACVPPCTSSADCDGSHVCGASSKCELPGSCRALKRAHDAALSGSYAIVPTGDASGAPLQVYCDMVGDGGGWMLVTPDMIASETTTGASIERTTDPNGGLKMAVLATSQGCSTTATKASQVVLFKDLIPWQQIRARQVFAGNASCWSIFGDRYWLGALDPNLFAFDPGVDFIHDQLRMGGTNGDAYDGMNNRCDNDPTNFWYAAGPDRSAIVGLRRKLSTSPAGLATEADCLDLGTTSWTYSDIYVREP